jgi:hypothetical protein
VRRVAGGFELRFCASVDSGRVVYVGSYDQRRFGGSKRDVLRGHRGGWRGLDAQPVAYAGCDGASGFLDDRGVWRNGDGGAWADRDLYAFLGTERWIRWKRDADVQRCTGHGCLQYLASCGDFERDDGCDGDGHGDNDGRFAGVLAGSTDAFRRIGRPPMMLAPWLVTALALFSLYRVRGNQRYRWAPAVALLVFAGLGLASCGGGSSSGGGGGGTGTEAGSYTITVSASATAGSTTLTHATKLTLVVQ